MTAAASNIIDIALDLIEDREKCFVVSQGEKDERGRDIWIFLPKSLVENSGDGTFAMPEWLAMKKGLI